LSSCGTILGALGGIALGRQLVGMYKMFFRFPDLVFQLDFSAVGIALAVGLGAATLGVFSAVRRAARLPPAEAMRPEPPANYRPSFGRTHRHRATSSRTRSASPSATSNAAPCRRFFTVAGLALATGILIIPNTFRDSVGRSSSSSGTSCSARTSTSGLVEPSSARIAHELAQLPGVTSLEPSRFAAVRIHFNGRSRQIGLRSLLPGAQHSRAVDHAGREIPPPTDGLVVSAKLAEVLGARVGDLLVVEALEGRRPVKTLPITGLAEDFTGIAAYMELSAINRFLGEGDVITGASLGLDLGKRGEFLAALKEIPRVSTVAIKESMRKSFRETTAQMMGLIQSIYLMFSVVVAFGVIYNNARISLAERARELATLRVVGMTQREVGAIIVIELVLLAVLAVPLGLVMGTGFATVIISTVSTETVRLPLVFTSHTYTFAVLVVVTASVFSALVVLRKLKQLDLIATLKAPE
jgi:putative ABC transport system permease protein